MNTLLLLSVCFTVGVVAPAKNEKHAPHHGDIEMEERLPSAGGRPPPHATALAPKNNLQHGVPKHRGGGGGGTHPVHHRRHHRRLAIGAACSSDGPACGLGLQCECAGRRLFGAPAAPACTCETAPSPPPPPSPPPSPSPPPPAWRFWRFSPIAPGAAQSGYWCLHEAKLYDTSDQQIDTTSVPTSQISAASYNGLAAGYYPPLSVFDGVLPPNGQEYCSEWDSGGSTGWVQIDFGAAQSFGTKYELCHKCQVDAPRSWTVSLSEDGVTWTVIDTQTGAPFGETGCDYNGCLTFHAPAAGG